MKIRYQNRIELLQGTLDLLIFQTLQWGPQHGYSLSQAIQSGQTGQSGQSGSGKVLQVDTGSRYLAWHRLERQKWVRFEWKVPENNQRVKVHRLTAADKQHLATERSRWEQVSAAIMGSLEPGSKA